MVIPVITRKRRIGDLPGGPAAKTLHFQGRKLSKSLVRALDDLLC